MSKKTQLNKNIDLSTKLADFIVKHPEKVKNIPSGSTYVVISAKDSDLNHMNNALIKNMVSKGKKVVKAIEKKTDRNTWDLQFVSP